MYCISNKCWDIILRWIEVWKFYEILDTFQVTALKRTVTMVRVERWQYPIEMFSHEKPNIEVPEQTKEEDDILSSLPF